MVQKTVQDYYDTICKEYPTIPEQDIKRILKFGFKSLYLHNNYGADVLLQRNGFWFYCGKLMNDSVEFFKYYKRKLATKIRILYKRNKVKWDGYYYFGLTQSQYDNYLKQKNTKGRPKKYFNFGTVVLYKIYDECSITESNKVAIFKVPMIYDTYFIKLEKDYKTGSAELLEVRDPLKLSDMLLSNFKFKSINV